ncbi:MAG: dihydroneopterin aldolase, partial [Candidatus Sumerlaeota bacterium]|nr:dihydroneopterin aldolase [Candidatus Sumerlaeota bacterium]
MDGILFRDLSLRCIVGVNPDERREKQDVVINLAIYGDLRKAGQSDRMKDAIDYRALKKRLVEFVE